MSVVVLLYMMRHLSMMICASFSEQKISPEGPTCFVHRQERMIMSRIFSSAEPGPQLTWTAMMQKESCDGP
jgi:hypothetical protein